MRASWIKATAPFANALAACGSEVSKTDSRTKQPAAAAPHEDHGGHDHQGHGAEHAGHTGMSDDDMALMMKQKTCPVSGEAFGEMGAPVKKVVGDQVVFLCCKSCSGEFDADPEKYLATAINPSGSDT